jgi:hypothetical protein
MRKTKMYVRLGSGTGAGGGGDGSGEGSTWVVMGKGGARRLHSWIL